MSLPPGAFPRAHHVGSFIRPENLIEARQAVEEKKMPAAELKTIKESAIRDVVQDAGGPWAQGRDRRRV